MPPAEKRSPMQSYAMPVVIALTCLAAWVLGGVLTRPNLDWYATLNKPGFTPANQVFPIVWTILYALMAVSAWLAWRAPGKEDDRRLALTWFFWQLAMGVLWSYAFFWLHSPGLALVVSFSLLVAITLTIVLFDRFKPSGGAAAPAAAALGRVRHLAQFRHLVS